MSGVAEARTVTMFCHFDSTVPVRTTSIYKPVGLALMV
ncbi:Uncharacterised protein [Vibrio cholerae]|nr:Uncharacterised protein [Vibrio cholerae]